MKVYSTMNSRYIQNNPLKKKKKTLKKTGFGHKANHCSIYPPEGVSSNKYGEVKVMNIDPLLLLCVKK